MAISYKKRLIIYERDYFKCRLCNLSPAIDKKIILQIDHILPKHKGGKDNIENLQTLCRSCNIYKGSKLETMDILQCKIKYKVPFISYPKQTFEDRLRRLNQGRCLIHPGELSNKKSKDKSIYKCGYKKCNIYLIKNNDSYYVPQELEHLLIGNFSLI